MIYGRSPTHAREILEHLQAGDLATATQIGLPAGLFAARGPEPFDAGAQAMLQPFIEKAAMTSAINDAWTMIAVLTALLWRAFPSPRYPLGVTEGAKGRSSRSSRPLGPTSRSIA